MPLGWQTTEGSPSGGDKLEVVASFCYLGDMLSELVAENRPEEVQGAATSSLFKPATSLSRHVAACTALVCGGQCSMPVRFGH